MKFSVTAIILAAGSGSRMNLDVTKQRIMVGEESVLRRSVRIFNECPDIDSIVVVARSDEMAFANSAVSGFEKVSFVVSGGNTRAESAAIGFSKISETSEYVAIHDAARCFVTSEMISAVINDAKIYGAATASAKVTDTVKRIDADFNITETVNRNELMLVQTPQVCRSDMYKKAIKDAGTLYENFTDDNMLLENIGVFPHCTDTGKNNIKITTKEDLAYADFLFNGEFQNG